MSEILEPSGDEDNDLSVEETRALERERRRQWRAVRAVSNGLSALTETSAPKGKPHKRATPTPAAAGRVEAESIAGDDFRSKTPADTLPPDDVAELSEALREIRQRETRKPPTGLELAERLFSDVIKQTAALFERDDLPPYLSDTIFLLNGLAGAASVFLLPNEVVIGNPQPWCIERHRLAAHRMIHQAADPAAAELRSLAKDIHIHAQSLQRAWRARARKGVKWELSVQPSQAVRVLIREKHRELYPPQAPTATTRKRRKR